MRLNAYTIILDEYYHAYNAADILSQLDEMYSTLPQFEYICSDSEHALTTIKNKLPDKHREIFEIIAVSIFETTLIREVVTTFQNESLHPSIRSYARDHMNDESRHYHFFYEILNYTWQHMSNESIEAIGPYIGEFLKLYLNIDQEKLFNFQIINWVLGNKIKCQQLINELYQGFAISEQIPIVNNVINVLKRTELFKHKAVQEGFKLAQLNFDLLTSPTKLLAE